MDEAPQQFSITHDIREADVAVIPRPLEQITTDTARLLVTRSVIAARTRGVRTIGFWCGDHDCIAGVDGISIYAQSTLRSRRNGEIETLPAWAADMLEKYHAGKLPPIVNGDRPTVSFCGNSFGAATTQMAKLHRFLWGIGRCVIKGTAFCRPHIRARTIETCIEDRRIEARFSLKNAGWRGFTFAGRPEPMDLEKDQSVFAQNLFSSIYALCVRGEGNFSYRLYEVLSAGRIPVIVDSDTLMPLHDEIDWRDVAVWVTKPEDTARAVLRHFRSRTSDELLEIQHSILRIWRDRLRPEKWFPMILNKR